ncbi:MAG: flagellin, partial [bacterium]
MTLSVNTNTTASSSARMLNINHAQLQRSLTKLSTGRRINSPADDAGGLAVSMKMSAAIRRNSAVQNNVSNAIAFLQTQDGALETFGHILERISELKMLHQDITKNTTDKANYDTEFTQLKAQLGNLAAEKFNSVNLFGTSLAAVAITEDGGQTVALTKITLAVIQASLAAAATLGALTVNSITTAISSIATDRAVNGASSNRLQYALDMLSINKVNLEAANGRILDADIASESTEFAKLQILSQANSAMLSQANLLPQAALRLIG